MNFAQNTISKCLTTAQSATNGTNQVTLDTQGYRHVRLCTYIDVSTVPAVLSVEHSDDNSTWVGMGLTGGTNFTLVGNNSSATTAPWMVFDIDMKGRKRYLRLYTTNTNSTTRITITANLGNPALGVPMTTTGLTANGAVLTLPPA